MRKLLTLVALALLSANAARADETVPMPHVSDIPAAQTAFESGAHAVTGAKYQRAIAFFSMGLAADNKAAQIYSNRAGCYWKLDKPDLALKDIQSALALDPTLDHAYHLRSDIYYDKNQPDKAWQEIDKACKLHPKYEPHYFQRGK